MATERTIAALAAAIANSRYVLPTLGADPSLDSAALREHSCSARRESCGLAWQRVVRRGEFQCH